MILRICDNGREQVVPASRELVERVFGCAKHAARIGEPEPEVLPDDGVGQDVARGPWDGCNHSPPGPGQPVEERRFAHVRPADEDDRGQPLRRHRCRLYLTGSQGVVADEP